MALSPYGMLVREHADLNQFGALRNPHTPPADDSDSEDEQEMDEGLAMPRIEEWRMNLTALSQYHNVCSKKNKPKSKESAHISSAIFRSIRRKDTCL